MITDPGGVVRWVNASCDELNGLVAGQMAGQNALDAMCVNSTELVSKVAAVAATGEPWQGPLSRTSQNGERYHVQQTITPIRDDSGAITHLLWISNAADDPHLLDRLTESEARFQRMADAAPVMIWTSGLDTLCDYFNKVWLDFTGRALKQELGNGWADGVHPDDFQNCLDVYLTSFEARRGFAMEYRLRRADGQYRWLLDNGVPRYSAAGTFEGFIGSCVDITEQKRMADAALWEKDERYRTVIETAMDGYWLSDCEGRLLEVNDAYCWMSGYTARNCWVFTFPILTHSKRGTRQTRTSSGLWTRGRVAFKPGIAAKMELSLTSKSVPSTSMPMVAAWSVSCATLPIVTGPKPP